MDPLPYLGARDLRGRGVLHQVVDRGGAGPAKPRRDVLDTDAHVRAQAGIRDGAAGDPDVEELLRGDAHLGTLAVELVRLLPERAVELAHSGLNEVGMRHPGAVESVGRFAFLVVANLRQG